MPVIHCPEQGGGASARLAGRRIGYAHPTNQGLNVFCGQITTTDVGPKVIGTIPAGGIPAFLSWSGRADSNAGSTATISIGFFNGTGVELMGQTSVKAGSATQNFPAAGAVMHQALATDTPITVSYAETGAPATAGGPWTVAVGFFMPG